MSAVSWWGVADRTRPLRVVLVGWGAIGRTTAAHIERDHIAIVGVGVRRDDPSRPPIPAGAELLTDPGHLVELRPDIVVEAAAREAVVPWGMAAFESGADFVVSSVSAFVDPDALGSLRAATNGARLHVSPGALAGVDGLAAASVLGLDEVRHRIVKPPRAWTGTPADGDHDLERLEGPTVLLRATASEVAHRFPQNANAAMTVALAGVGPDATEVTLVADPSASSNRHEIRATGAFGRLRVDIENEPLPANPKTSALAALSLVRCLRNRSSTFSV